MRAWLGMGALVAAVTCGGACGGNVVVDGSTVSTGGSGTTSGGSTEPHCQQTCLEYLKNGGGVCSTSPANQAAVDLDSCAQGSCPTVCGAITESGAPAACLDRLAQQCMNALMVCTAS
jgi:hypothetical protein